MKPSGEHLFCFRERGSSSSDENLASVHDVVAICQAINVRMGLSFSEYINRLRIAYAIQLKEMNPDLLSSDIAFRSGFSSRASFYRNLKLYQNHPPLSNRNKQPQ
ncbi:MAG: AraC family transcriptional regulator [Bacteroidaceae bacterium]|nr:AraC family transcriptional regulator [Bacteroidaceae bacterium]